MLKPSPPNSSQRRFYDLELLWKSAKTYYTFCLKLRPNRTTLHNCTESYIPLKLLISMIQSNIGDIRESPSLLSQDTIIYNLRLIATITKDIYFFWAFKDDELFGIPTNKNSSLETNDNFQLCISFSNHQKNFKFPHSQCFDNIVPMEIPTLDPCFTTEFAKRGFRFFEDNDYPNSSKLDHIIEFIKHSSYLKERIEFTYELKPKDALLEPGTDLVSNELIRNAICKHLRSPQLAFYSHQAEAIQAFYSGNNIIVCTPTSSGKSLIYQSILLNELIKDPSNCAILIFPTKALAQDQIKSFKELISFLPEQYRNLLMIFRYDGDTPFDKRSEIIRNANILVTNPDMIHHTILPNHSNYSRLLSRLTILVADEAHFYKGLFGIHCSFIFKRLYRICIKLYRIAPQIICSSATLNNADDHYQNLFGCSRKLKHKSISRYNRLINRNCNETISDQDYLQCPFTLITQDGSPSGKRTYIFWNPPLVSEVIDNIKDNRGCGSSQKMNPIISNDCEQEQDETEHEKPSPQTLTGWHTWDEVGTKRASSILEISLLMVELVCQGCRTITFCRYRKLVEVVLLHVTTLLKSRGKSEEVSKVMSYRAGYPAEDRETIANNLFTGKLLGVVCTNALELGINVGNLDASLILGFPGSISSMHQQFGRSGRGTRDALSIMVALNSPVEQYLIKNADELLNRPSESVTLNIGNPLIMEKQLQCAFEELESSDPDFDSELFSSHIEEKKSGIYFHITGHYKTNWDTKSKPPKRPKLNYNRLDIRGITNLKLKIVESLTATKPADDLFKLKLSPRTRALNWSLNSLNITCEVDMYKNISTELNQNPGSNSSSHDFQDYSNLKVIDEVDYNLSYFVAHPGATYLNRGKEYIIEKLDLERMIAFAVLSSVNYYTKTRDHTDVDPIYTIMKYDLPSNLFASIAMGQVQVQLFVYGYRKLHKFNSKPFDGIIDLDLPPIAYQTTGLWLETSDEMHSFLMALNIEAFQALHAASHALTLTIAKFLNCYPLDIGCECPHPFDRRSRPKRIMIYDSNLGGSGLIESAFKILPDIVRVSLKLVENCNCQSGCDSCIFNPFCGEFNDVLSKEGAIWVLQSFSEATNNL